MDQSAGIRRCDGRFFENARTRAFLGRVLLGLTKRPKQKMEGNEVAKLMERRYVCKNGVVERTRFMVGDNTTERPRWRKAKSLNDKRDENARAAVRQLARILNCNADQSWWFVKLDFSPKQHEKIFAGMDQDEILRETERQGSLFLRRLKRNAKGCELKCAYSPSDMDEETGEIVRPHLHIAVSGVTEETIRKSWRLGECTHTEHLYAQKDYTPLAAYMVDQVRSIPNLRKFVTTQNMEKPKIEDRVVTADPMDEIRVQPGAKILDRTPYREGCGSQYVRYLQKPKNQKRGGHKEYGSYVPGREIAGASETTRKENKK